MKKQVEDLQMSINEKDAEIIKLNMHLGDEKKRYQNLMRIQHSSQKSLLAHNASTQSLLVRPQKDPMVGSGDAVQTPTDGAAAQIGIQFLPLQKQLSNHKRLNEEDSSRDSM